MNANKTDYMCFNKKGDISTLNGGSLKLVDKFTYPGSCVTSTENDINVSSEGMDYYRSVIDHMEVKYIRK